MKSHTIARVMVVVAAGAALPLLLHGCGGGGGSLTPFTVYNPLDQPASCSPGNDVNGSWKVLSNNLTSIPDSAALTFFSYNQPSINTQGMVVFRGRARAATGENGNTGGAGGVTRGVFAIDACLRRMTLYTVADGDTTVPAPNSTGAMFNEFPSIPRIDMSSGILATRGESDPVWTLPDGTRQGTAGLYVSLPQGLTTAVGQLGNIAEFSYMQVPGASTTGVRFDQFPGSPAMNGSTVVFKGNYTDGTTSATGVYFRNLASAGSVVSRIADTTMVIPTSNNTASTLFGSTAPPSAASNTVVFTGLDNESAPTLGGLFSAPLTSNPTLTSLVAIGLTEVVDATGTPLPPIAPAVVPPTFSQVGEALSFDGRDIVFWGAWDNGVTKQVRMNCPTDGEASVINACNTQYPAGYAMLSEPVNQGIFVYDTVTHALRMVAQAGASGSGALFQDFIFWTFSGAPPSAGSGTTDAEPPRWRAATFAAVDSSRGVLFKGSLNAVSGGATPPASGLYGAPLAANDAVGSVFKVIELGDAMSTLDPAAPAGSYVTSLGLERESLRSGWLALTASSLNAASESWAGIYATYFPSAFRVIPPVAPATMGVLALGS